ncbi:hypothetical protein [Sinorhizobium sojae]|nr:hypothetical protein [Sinorhizobium sojae]
MQTPDPAHQLADHIEAMRLATFRARLSPPEGPAGQWILDLGDEMAAPNRPQLLLNFFDPDSFGALWVAGELVPHAHERPFATRLLSGRYAQWLYHRDETGTLHIVEKMHVAAGQIYGLGSERIHLILMPAEGTLSLSIRGPARGPAGTAPQPPLPEDAAARIRERMLAALRDAPPAKAALLGIWD